MITEYSGLLGTSNIVPSKIVPFRTMGNITMFQFLKCALSKHSNGEFEVWKIDYKPGDRLWLCRYDNPVNPGFTWQLGTNTPSSPPPINDFHIDQSPGW